jgi:hypothetical protein
MESGIVLVQYIADKVSKEIGQFDIRGTTLDDIVARTLLEYYIWKDSQSVVKVKTDDTTG